MKKLVVVESPNKIAKVSKCLGPEFTVVATVGHFRDLPEDELGVEVSSFTPQYETLPGKAAVVSKLREAARGVSVRGRARACGAASRSSTISSWARSAAAIMVGGP